MHRRLSDKLGLQVFVGLAAICLPAHSNAAPGFTFTCKTSPFGGPMIVSGESPKGKGVIVTNGLPLLPVHDEVLSDSIAISTKADPNGTLVVALRHPDPGHITGTWLLTSWDAPPSSSEIECKEGIWAFP
jgi:hypothetical protein